MLLLILIRMLTSGQELLLMRLLILIRMLTSGQELLLMLLLILIRMLSSGQDLLEEEFEEEFKHAAAVEELVLPLGLHEQVVSLSASAFHSGAITSSGRY